VSGEPPAHGSAAPGGAAGWPVRVATVFLALTAAGALVHICREFVAPLVLAALLLLLIDGIERDLEARFPRVPRMARAALAVMLIVAGFAAAVLILVFRAPPFALQLVAIEPRLNELLAQASGLIGQQPITVREIFRGAEVSQTLARAFRAARSATIFAGLTILYLGFLIASRSAFRAKLALLFSPGRARHRAAHVMGVVRNAVEQYVRLVTLKALAVAVIVFAVMAAFGVHAPLFIGFLAFLFAYVPIVGAFAAAAFPALIAFAQQGDAGRAALILAILGVCVLGVDNLVMPKLQGDELNIDPLLVLISIGFWTLLLGPTGALLSTPLTVTVMAVAAEFDGARWLAILISKDGEPLNEARSQPSGAASHSLSGRRQ
jgi:AI-2 transport protein TqsA